MGRKERWKRREDREETERKEKGSEERDKKEDREKYRYPIMIIDTSLFSFSFNLCTLHSLPCNLLLSLLSYLYSPLLSLPLFSSLLSASLLSFPSSFHTYVILYFLLSYHHSLFGFDCSATDHELQLDHHRNTRYKINIVPRIVLENQYTMIKKKKRYSALFVIINEAKENF